MTSIKSPHWYPQRVNDEARKQWAPRPTGVSCSKCGAEIVAVNKKAYVTIVANDGLFDMYCQDCAWGRG